MRLPRSLDELTGLRAARWIRESTRGQLDNFGPDAQRDQQDRAIERYGLVDTGIVWLVSHSGRTVGNTDQFLDMLARAGTDYDVLVIGYVSRFARDARTALNARHDLHQAGAAVLFADERILTSDEDRWMEYYRETGEAEAYSRRLSKRISEGYAAKFRRLSDQAGNPPWGFRRIERMLAPDPERISDVIRCFERFVQGNVTTGQLAAEFGVGVEQVRKALRNPIYNGWAQRHRGQERVPAPWRASPPVSDELWERAQAVRLRRAKGGCRPGRWRRGVDPLGGLLYCVCGRRVNTNGTAGTPARRQRIHPRGDCEAWGGHRTTWAEVHDVPIAMQIGGLKLDAGSLTRIVEALTRDAVPAPPSIDVARLERQKRELALEHAAGKIDDATYLARMTELRRATPAAQVEEPTVEADAVVEALQSLAALWADPDLTDDDRSRILHSIYDRIEVVRDAVVRVHLTPWAYRHGLAALLPELVKVKVDRRIRRPRQESGRPYQRQRIQIVGRREWLSSIRRTA